MSSKWAVYQEIIASWKQSWFSWHAWLNLLHALGVEKLPSGMAWSISRKRKSKQLSFNSVGQTSHYLLFSGSKSCLWGCGILWSMDLAFLGSTTTLVLDSSPGFTDIVKGRAPECAYTINGNTYHQVYYLADGIYPNSLTLVKTISQPQGLERKVKINLNGFFSCFFWFLTLFHSIFQRFRRPHKKTSNAPLESFKLGSPYLHNQHSHGVFKSYIWLCKHVSSSTTWLRRMRGIHLLIASKTPALVFLLIRLNLPTDNKQTYQLLQKTIVTLGTQLLITNCKKIRFPIFERIREGIHHGKFIIVIFSFIFLLYLCSNSFTLINIGCL